MAGTREVNHFNKINHDSYMCNSLFPVVPPSSSSSSPVIMKIDSGASGTYIREKDEHCLDNLKKSTDLQVTLPDNSISNASTIGALPIPALSTKGAKAHVFPKLHSASLLSVG